MPTVRLTDHELVLLDGRCSAEAQKAVDAALARLAARERLPHLTAEQAAFVADVVTAAREEGRLTCVNIGLRCCRVCGAAPGYATYKSGSRKGRRNYNRPLSLSGVDLARGFIVLEGHAKVGCCNACFQAVRDTLAAELWDVPAEVPERVTGYPPRWKRYERRRCTQCGWEGNEGAMRMLPALMSGRYPGGCPSCSAENKPLGRTVIEHVDGFDVESVATQEVTG